MAPWVFIGAVPLALASSVALFHWLARGSSRVTGMPQTSPDRKYVGGVTTPTMSATWPLARLELYDSGIRLAGSVRIVRWIIPVWETQYAELTKAEMVAAPLHERGVRFSAHNASPIIFWTFDAAAEIVDILEGRGVPVDRSVSRIGWTGM